MIDENANVASEGIIVMMVRVVMMTMMMMMMKMMVMMVDAEITLDQLKAFLVVWVKYVSYMMMEAVRCAVGSGGGGGG